MLFLKGDRASEANARTATCFIEAETSSHVVLDQHRQMRFDFLLEVLIELSNVPECAKSRPEMPQSREHTSPPGETQHPTDDARDTFPARGFGRELLTAGPRNRVEL